MKKRQVVIERRDTSPEAVRDRAKGALWGLVVGDCLGDFLQFGLPRKEGAFITEMMSGGPFGTPRGYWTDDSSMAMCIMDSVVRMGGSCDVRDVADTFLKWYRNGYLSSLDHAFDVGGATAFALRDYAIRGSLKNGTEATQGNGSLMRLAPTALLRNDRNAVSDVSDITHASTVVRRCAATLADTIQRFVFKSEDVCKDEYRGRYVTCDDCGNIVLAPRSEVRNGGHAPDTLDSAFWAFLSTDTFGDALVQAVNNGHDADTVGAVCGQIAGAFYGFSAIPKTWVHDVKDWRKVDALIESFLDLVLPETKPTGYEPTPDEGSIPE